LYPGYGLIYTPYKSVPVNNKQRDAYEILYDGFKASVAAHATEFDTTNIGFVAHSFGAGAVPYVSNKLMTIDNWGGNGAFLYLMSPWYPCVISSVELARYPKSTNLLIQIFDDDRINDPRIARAIYDLIGIPVSNKKCMTLFSDSIPGFTLHADHDIPCKTPEQITIYHKNALFRTFDLLSSLTFYQDSIARMHLFPSADTTNVTLAYWKFGHAVRPALLSNNVPVTYPQKSYVNFWDHLINPFNEFNTNFNRPVPIFFRTRVTLKNYWYTWTNGHDKEPVKKDTSFMRPENGFGSDGRWFTKASKIPNPRVRTRSVKIFEPKGIDTLAPVIFLSHSILTPGVKNHMGLINHLVSKGTIVIYVNSVAIELELPFRGRYDILMSGFREATDLLKYKIDTTRIGFIGHGFSAGAIPAIAHDYIVRKNWGSNGSFLFLSSPWFMYYMNSNKLNSFPDNCRMIVQVYENEKTNDWKIGADIFDKISLPYENKNFIILASDKNGKNRLKANTRTFCSRIGARGSRTINALDYYGIYRLVDALSAVSFYNDSTAECVALRFGSPEQRYMGTWRDGTPIRELISTDMPENFLKKKRYFWSWNSGFNDRKDSVEYVDRPENSAKKKPVCK